MTRGRPPLRAQEDAGPVAEKRGLVMHYRHEAGAVCNFSILSPGRVTLVRIRRMRRLRCPAGEIERDFSADIAALRCIASSPAISRELWLCSPKGAWRFFRTDDGAIIELGPDGLPLAPGRPEPAGAAVP